MNLNKTLGQIFTNQNINKSKNITIKQLLNHTSGYKDDIDLFDFSSIEEAVLPILWEGPELNIGSQFNYSDNNSAILALIIKKVTGLSPEKYLEIKIIELLELKSTYYKLEDDYRLKYMIKPYFKE